MLAWYLLKYCYGPVSVCLSLAGIVSKWLNGSTIGTQFYTLVEGNLSVSKNKTTSSGILSQTVDLENSVAVRRSPQHVVNSSTRQKWTLSVDAWCDKLETVVSSTTKVANRDDLCHAVCHTERPCTYSAMSVVYLFAKM